MTTPSMAACPHGATRNTLVSLAILATGIALAVVVVAPQTGSATGRSICASTSARRRRRSTDRPTTTPRRSTGSGARTPRRGRCCCAWCRRWTSTRRARSGRCSASRSGCDVSGLVQLGSAATSVRTVLVRLDRPDYALACAMWPLSLVTAPVWNTLNQGQIKHPALAAHRHRPGPGRALGPQRGGFAGLATALKLTPGIFVVANLLVLAAAPRPSAWSVAFAVVTALAVALGVVRLHVLLGHARVREPTGWGIRREPRTTPSPACCTGWACRRAWPSPSGRWVRSVSSSVSGARCALCARRRGRRVGGGRGRIGRRGRCHRSRGPTTSSSSPSSCRWCCATSRGRSPGAGSSSRPSRWCSSTRSGSASLGVYVVDPHPGARRCSSSSASVRRAPDAPASAPDAASAASGSRS